MTTEFIDPAGRMRDRSTAFERKHDPSGCCAGFLSFEEMRVMEKSGLVEIQSHAMTHTWYPKGPKIVDFWHPGSATEAGGPVWMLWNRLPEKKPFYLTEASSLEGSIPYGTPVYEHGKALETLRYFPDETELEAKLIETVKCREPDFFREKGWKEELLGLVSGYRAQNGTKGRYETGVKYEARIRSELTESKQILENGLGHPVDGICWPGGGVNTDVIGMARQVGYRYLNLPSKWKDRFGHPEFHGMISRITSLPRIYMKGRDLGYPSKEDFRSFLRFNNGYRAARLSYDIGRIRKYLGGRTDGA
jgi:hypothetical protein